MPLAKFVRLSAITIGALSVAAQVNAADLYAGSGLKDSPVYAPAWTGVYLGAHVGGAWADLKNNYNYNETDGYNYDWGYARDGSEELGYRRVQQRLSRLQLADQRFRAWF